MQMSHPAGGRMLGEGAFQPNVSDGKKRRIKKQDEGTLQMSRDVGNRHLQARRCENGAGTEEDLSPANLTAADGIYPAVVDPYSKQNSLMGLIDRMGGATGAGNRIPFSANHAAVLTDHSRTAGVRGGLLPKGEETAGRGGLSTHRNLPMGQHALPHSVEERVTPTTTEAGGVVKKRPQTARGYFVGTTRGDKGTQVNCVRSHPNLFDHYQKDSRLSGRKDVNDRRGNQSPPRYSLASTPIAAPPCDTLAWSPGRLHSVSESRSSRMYHSALFRTDLNDSQESQPLLAAHAIDSSQAALPGAASPEGRKSRAHKNGPRPHQRNQQLGKINHVSPGRNYPSRGLTVRHEIGDDDDGPMSSMLTSDSTMLARRSMALDNDKEQDSGYHLSQRIPTHRDVRLDRASADNGMPVESDECVLLILEEARAYLNGSDGRGRDFEKAHALYKHAALMGSVEAKYILALFHRQGVTVKKDADAFARNVLTAMPSPRGGFSKTIEGKYMTTSQLALFKATLQNAAGVSFMESNDADLVTAAEYFRDAMEVGVVEASRNMALAILESVAEAKAKLVAIRDVAQHAEQSRCRQGIQFFLESGHLVCSPQAKFGVESDVKSSALPPRILPSSTATPFLTEQLNNLGASRRLVDATALLDQIAEAAIDALREDGGRDARILYNLGVAYERGLGTSNCPRILDAVHLYQQADHLEHYPKAQLALGKLHLRRLLNPVPISHQAIAEPETLEEQELKREGLYWLRVAAENGEPEAQALWGAIYAEGAIGVPEDRDEAIRCFVLAEEGGWTFPSCRGASASTASNSPHIQAAASSSAATLIALVSRPAAFQMFVDDLLRDPGAGRYPSERSQSMNSGPLGSSYFLGGPVAKIDSSADGEKGVPPRLGMAPSKKPQPPLGSKAATGPNGEPRLMASILRNPARTTSVAKGSDFNTARTWASRTSSTGFLNSVHGSCSRVDACSNSGSADSLFAPDRECVQRGAHYVKSNKKGDSPLARYRPHDYLYDSVSKGNPAKAQAPLPGRSGPIGGVGENGNGGGQQIQSSGRTKSTRSKLSGSLECNSLPRKCDVPRKRLPNSDPLSQPRARGKASFSRLLGFEVPGRLRLDSTIPSKEERSQQVSSGNFPRPQSTRPPRGATSVVPSVIRFTQGSRSKPAEVKNGPRRKFYSFPEEVYPSVPVPEPVLVKGGIPFSRHTSDGSFPVESWYHPTASDIRDSRRRRERLGGSSVPAIPIAAKRRTWRRGEEDSLEEDDFGQPENSILPVEEKDLGDLDVSQASQLLLAGYRSSLPNISPPLHPDSKTGEGRPTHRADITFPDGNMLSGVGAESRMNCPNPSMLGRQSKNASDRESAMQRNEKTRLCSANSPPIPSSSTRDKHCLVTKRSGLIVALYSRRPAPASTHGPAFPWSRAGQRIFRESANEFDSDELDNDLKSSEAISNTLEGPAQSSSGPLPISPIEVNFGPVPKEGRAVILPRGSHGLESEKRASCLVQDTGYPRFSSSRYSISPNIKPQTRKPGMAAAAKRGVHRGPPVAPPRGPDFVSDDDTDLQHATDAMADGVDRQRKIFGLRENSCQPGTEPLPGAHLNTYLSSLPSDLPETVSRENDAAAPAAELASRPRSLSPTMPPPEHPHLSKTTDEEAGHVPRTAVLAAQGLRPNPDFGRHMAASIACPIRDRSIASTSNLKRRVNISMATTNPATPPGERTSPLETPRSQSAEVRPLASAKRSYKTARNGSSERLPNRPHVAAPLIESAAFVSAESTPLNCQNPSELVAPILDEASSHTRPPSTRSTFVPEPLPPYPESDGGYLRNLDSDGRRRPHQKYLSATFDSDMDLLPLVSVRSERQTRATSTALQKGARMSSKVAPAERLFHWRPVGYSGKMLTLAQVRHALASWSEPADLSEGQSSIQTLNTLHQAFVQHTRALQAFSFGALPDVWVPLLAASYCAYPSMHCRVEPTVMVELLDEAIAAHQKSLLDLVLKRDSSPDIKQRALEATFVMLTRFLQKLLCPYGPIAFEAAGRRNGNHADNSAGGLRYPPCGLPFPQDLFQPPLAIATCLAFFHAWVDERLANDDSHRSVHAKTGAQSAASGSSENKVASDDLDTARSDALSRRDLGDESSSDSLGCRGYVKIPLGHLLLLRARLKVVLLGFTEGALMDWKMSRKLWSTPKAASSCVHAWRYFGIYNLSLLKVTNQSGSSTITPESIMQELEDYVTSCPPAELRSINHIIRALGTFPSIGARLSEIKATWERRTANLPWCLLRLGHERVPIWRISLSPSLNDKKKAATPNGARGKFKCVQLAAA